MGRRERHRPRPGRAPRAPPRPTSHSLAGPCAGRWRQPSFVPLPPQHAHPMPATRPKGTERQRLGAPNPLSATGLSGSPSAFGPGALPRGDLRCAARSRSKGFTLLVRLSLSRQRASLSVSTVRRSSFALPRQASRWRSARPARRSRGPPTSRDVALAAPPIRPQPSSAGHVPPALRG